MGELKSFSRLVMCTDIKDRLVFESLPFNITVSRNVVSFSEISAVNLIVSWKLLACSMNRVISCLSESQREKMSSM